MGDDKIKARRKPGDGSYRYLPPRLVTINQIVAYNLAYWRKVAGLTQEELGERLPGGWSKNAVSAAERSWDGRRARQFDADELIAIAGKLGVPVLALFLPPDDDGVEGRYMFTTGNHALAGQMKDLFALVIPDSHYDTPVMAAYRDRLADSAGRYLDAKWSDVARWLEGAAAAEVRATQLDRLNWQREALLQLAVDLDALARAIKAQGDGQ